MSATDALAQTPIADWHRQNGAAMVPFAGWEMPLRYSGIVAEHVACRSGAAIFDVSHMARLRLEGSGAVTLLDRVLTRPVSDMPIGGVRYALICDDQGGIIDDILVTHVGTPSGTQYFLMVVNASNRAAVIEHLTPHVEDIGSVMMTDRTELSAMFAVQGPRAIESTAKLFDHDPGKLKRYTARSTQQMGKPVIVSRTGYTGEDGIELIVRADHAARVWENLLLAGRHVPILPAGLAARDTLRMEAAMPLYGHEIDRDIDPVTAGLKWAVKFDDRAFVGNGVIRRIAKSGPLRRRVGLKVDGRRPPRQGCEVLNRDGQRVGAVTSGGPSPTLGINIAMAILDASVPDDAELSVDIRGRGAGAAIVPLPFYKR